MKRLNWMILALIITFVVSTPVPAKYIFDETGMSISIGSQGRGNIIANYDDDHDFYWNSLGFFGRYHLREDNFGSQHIDYIDQEFDFGWMRWQPKGNSNDGVRQTLSLESRLMFMRQLIGRVDIGAGGGLALLSSKDNTYNLTKDGFYGLITGRIRYVFYNGCSDGEGGVDVEIDHISSVFGKDPGENIWKLRFYIVF